MNNNLVALRLINLSDNESIYCISGNVFVKPDEQC